jgi:hypothetical protein
LEHVASGDYNRFQSATSLIGGIASIPSPEAARVILKLSRPAKPSYQYISLITYTCVGKLAEMVAGGMEAIRPEYEALVCEYPLLLIQTNNFQRSIKKLEYTLPDVPIDPHGWRHYCDPTKPNDQAALKHVQDYLESSGMKQANGEFDPQILDDLAVMFGAPGNE